MSALAACVAAADFCPVYAEFPGGDVEQPFNDKHAMLPPGPAIGGDDGFVGEHGRKFTIVILNVIRPQQGALAVEGYGQAVGSIGPGIVQENVMNT